MEPEVIEIPKTKTSTELAELAKALAAAQALMEPATKDQENPFFKSRYADLASVWKACRDPLTKNGLAVTQLVTAEAGQVTVTTILLHSSGQFISTQLTLKAEKETPQAIGSAITYARRYALSAIVGISAEDDDANTATTGKPAVAKPQSKSSKPQPPAQPSISDLQAKFVQARKLLGDEQFFAIIGQQGYSTPEEITDIAVAAQILRDMGDVYKAKQNEK